MNKLIIKIIKMYQKHISPNTPPKCKYSPTCSEYSLQCYKKFNFFKAFVLSLYRICRCNVFSKGGYDPVPLNMVEKSIKKSLSIFDQEKHTLS